MAHMVVTLEVSRLSGWLNADAPCRVERRGHAMRGEVRAGRREGVGRRQRKRHARGEGPTQGLLVARARAERTENMAHMVVTLDVSQLEMFALKLFKL
jgi:hypothetical protein